MGADDGSCQSDILLKQPRKDHNTVKEQDGPTDSFRSRMAGRLPGFRTGGLWAAGLAIFTLVVNATMLVILQTRHTDDNNLANLYLGSCDKVETMQLWTHFSIVRFPMLLQP